MLFVIMMLKRLRLNFSQVHIQQVGLKELKRAEILHERLAHKKRKERLLLEKAGIKAQL